MEMDSDPAARDVSAGPAMDGDGTPAAFVAGMVLGAVVGAGIALLLAPDAGPRTRRKVGRRMRSLGDRAREELDDATRDQRRRMKRRRRKLERQIREAVSDRF